LQHALKTLAKRGVLLEAESRLVRGALSLEHMHVKEEMRPREEILYYDLRDPLETIDRLMADQETSRIPVCEGGIDHIVGILTVRNYFLSRPQIRSSQDLIPLLRKPYYVPETMKASALLALLRDRSESLAIVVDEYGSVTGLITQEDLIEKVVGQIADRRDEKNAYTRSGSDVIIASGKLELSTFGELFGEELQSAGGAVTLGGWLIEQLGDIPQAGAKYATDRFFFYVLAADPNRVRRIYVRRLHPEKRNE
jgi:CBS domain containing-hemolysin-like protein